MLHFVWGDSELTTLEIKNLPKTFSTSKCSNFCLLQLFCYDLIYYRLLYILN